MADLYVGREDEFEDRGRKVIVSGGLEVGVFFVDGGYYAYENKCVHQGVELIADDKTSQGLAWSEEDVHIVCPWHGYEFNIKTGIHPGHKNARLRSFDVKVTDGDVYVVT